MTSPVRAGERDERIAIVGMSCLFPGSPDLSSYWTNIVNGVDCTREISDREWSLSEFYAPEMRGFGGSYSKRGGFISEHAYFDPLKFGIMPSAVAGSDPDQFLTLKVAYDAMADAGYLERQLDLDRAEVILGRISAPGAGAMNMIQQSKTVGEIVDILRHSLPEGSEEVIAKAEREIRQRLVDCNSDTIPGAMPSVLAGRIAAKLGFRGRNLLVDAACASSMVAVETAVDDLLSGRCDFALAGGLHVNASAVFYQMFCGLGALSRQDVIRPFDQFADGTLLGEGIGIICLKRLDDAIRDGDRVYATICGIASSSDGHGGGVLSPNMDGEALAMEKAFQMAGVSPRTIGLLEAHGTGTPTGDVVELKAVSKVFGERTDEPPWCAIGSVKSMIGHCQSASAVAGIIKSALALHHKILPPTINVKQPNTKVDWSKHPCYLNTSSRPWINGSNSGAPRRAGVSAFGFGGINGHVILEEFGKGEKISIDSPVEDILDDKAQSLLQEFPTEVFAFAAESEPELLNEIDRLILFLNHRPSTPLKDIAYSVNSMISVSAHFEVFRLAIVASDAGQLLDRLVAVKSRISSATEVHEPDRGIYFTNPGLANGGDLAFVYPGLGSAYHGMLAELCIHFPEVRAVFDIVDTVAVAAGAEVLPSSVIFPRSNFDSNDKTLPPLASEDFAVVAVLLAEYALHQLLMHLGIEPDVVMGCSTGEFAAITTAGAVDVLSVAETFYSLSTKVARAVPADALAQLRSLRILASAERVQKLGSPGEVHVSADLGDDHIIVTGSIKAVEHLSKELASERIIYQTLPYAIPYHTPLVKGLIDKNHASVQSVKIKPFSVPAWSCSTGALISDEEQVIRDSFTELFTKTVLLKQTIRAMYASGVRNFVEVGPNGVLTAVVKSVLGHRAHLAIATNVASRSAITQINHLVAAVFIQGIKPNFDYLHRRRNPELIDWRHPAAEKQPPSERRLDLRHKRLEVPDLRDLLPEHAVQYVEHSEPNLVDQENAQAQEAAQLVGHDGVVSTFLNTNKSFYDQMMSTQEEVMQAFLNTQMSGLTFGESMGDPLGINLLDQGGMSSGGWSGFRLDQGAIGMEGRYAFQDRLQLLRDDAEVTELTLGVNLHTDLYLLDHAIGGPVAAHPAVSVHLMPLMVSLEIMAEAALARAKRGVVSRIEQVKAYRRIVVDQNPLTLGLRATSASDRIRVELFDCAEVDILVLVADFIFSLQHLPAPQPRIAVSGQVPTNLKTRRDLYRPDTMFHGPTMQLAQSIESVGEKTISGVAATTESTGWIRGADGATSLIHPLLLDNSSQFVLFYLYEKLLPAKALLPFFIESIEIFGSASALPPNVMVRANLAQLTERATEASVEIIDGDGLVHTRINGINSRRITLSGEWLSFVEDPLRKLLGQRIDTSGKGKADCALVSLNRHCLPADEATLEWCLDYVLTADERKCWRDQFKFEKRKLDWLLGRMACKEAARILVKDRFGVICGPLDFEVENDHRNRPVIRCSVADMQPLAVSISHAGERGVALSCFANEGDPGVDIELVEKRDPDFAERFLSRSELEHLVKLSEEQRDSEVTRMWAAKEAMYKALGGDVELTALRIDSANSDSLLVAGPTITEPVTVHTTACGDSVISYLVDTN